MSWVILGIIASIAVPTLISTRDAAMQSYAQGVASTIRSSLGAYYSKVGSYGDLDALVAGGYLDSRFTGNIITDFDSRSGLNIEFVNGGQTFACTITVPRVGVITLDETGIISIP